MRKIAIEKEPINGVPIVAYDCSLELTKRKANALVFESGRNAAYHLGVPVHVVYRNTKSKEKVWSPKYNTWYALRVKIK